MFGKPIAEYLRFERWILAAILIVGLMRLVLSLAGAPGEFVKLVSTTVVLLVGVVYAGVATATRGFGTYRQLLPLLFFQAVATNGIAALAIALAGLTGRPNVFTAPEYTNLPNYWPHALGHVAGMLIFPIALWPAAALVMWVTGAIRGGAPAGARA